MSDGKGCTCYASYSGECVCDADWTPSEVADLRQQLEKLSNDSFARGERYQALLAAKDQEIAELEKQVAQLEQDPHDTEYGISVVAWSKYEEVKRHLASCQAQVDALQKLVEIKDRRHGKELASCQAQNQRLREALEQCKCGCGGWEHCQDCDGYGYKPHVRKALAMPTDDSALFEFGMRIADRVYEERKQSSGR